MLMTLGVCIVELLKEIGERVWIKLRSWASVIAHNERDFLDFILAGIAALVICVVIYYFS